MERKVLSTAWCKKVKKIVSFKDAVLNSVPKVVGNSVPVRNRYESLTEDDESAGKITTDSGAADCVMPRNVLKNKFPLLPPKEGVKFCAANGTPIENYGRRNVPIKAAGKEGLNCVQFHVTDVKKPLASVSRSVER